MPFRAPDFDDINHSWPLKRGLQLPLLDPFVERLAEEARIHAGRADRQDVKNNMKTAMSVIVANIYQAHLIDPNRYVSVQRGNKDSPAGIFNTLDLKRGSVRDSVSFLIRDEHPYVENRGGNYDNQKKIGYTTRLRAGRHIIEEIEEVLFQNGEPLQIDHLSITRTTLWNNPNSPLLSKLFLDTPLPSIRLKGLKPKDGGSARLLSFEPSDETRRMETNLTVINRFIDAHHIDLLVSDEVFRLLSMGQHGEEDDFGEQNDASLGIDLNFRKSLYRVFNNGSFAEGGRFYGGWWQCLPGTIRQKLTINWYPTVELDFSNMQIAMLYAGEGLPFEGDAYSIEGIPPEYRPLIKRLLLQVINASDRFRAPMLRELPDGWTFKALVAAIKAKHAPIAKHFQSGIGIRLQRRDADIAERVMLRLMEEGILALPVHDSFIVVDGRQGRLEQVMVEAYEAAFGQPITIKAGATLFEELPRDDELARRFGFVDHEAYRRALAEDGLRSLVEDITDIEDSPEYEQYRLRKQAFFQMKGEQWGHEHNFLR